MTDTDYQARIMRLGMRLPHDLLEEVQQLLVETHDRGYAEGRKDAASDVDDLLCNGGFKIRNVEVVQVAAGK